MAREEMTVDLKVGTNEITEEAEEAAKALDKLEGQEVEVKFRGDTSQITRDIDDVISKVDKLSGTGAAELILTSNAAQISNEIADLIGDIDKLDATDPTIDVKAENIATLEAGLDKIAAKAREISATPVNLDTSTATSGIDRISDSARGANSALANMVGNAAQDIGAVGGVAGSAGVAIGQMAEYFSDAALGGEKMGSALKSMAAVAAPIALIAGVVQAISGAMAAAQQRTEQATATTKDFGDAMSSAADDALGLADSLRENESALREFDASKEILGDFGTLINDAGKNVPLLGALFQDTSVDIVAAMTAAGLSMYDFTTAVEGGAASRDAFKQQLEDFRDAGFITSDQFKALTQATTDYGNSFDKASEGQKLFNVNAEEANAILDELVAKEAPLSKFADTWKILFDDMADGAVNTEAAADAINFLADKLGLTQEQVVALAQAELDKVLEDDAKAADEAAKAMEKLGEAAVDTAESIVDAFIGVKEAEKSLLDLSSAFSQMSIDEDALSRVFDIGNAPEEAAASIRDIALEIADLSEAAKDIDLKIPVEVGRLDADPLLDAFDALRPQIQAKVTEAFATGGPEAGRAMAASYIEQVFAELKGKVSREEIAALLGLDNIEATIAVALDVAAVEKARAQLAILTGLGGVTPWTASIALALDAGTIDPVEAQRQIQEHLRALGVDIPLTLVPPPPPELPPIPDVEVSLRFGEPGPPTIPPIPEKEVSLRFGEPGPFSPPVIPQVPIATGWSLPETFTAPVIPPVEVPTILTSPADFIPFVGALRSTFSADPVEVQTTLDPSGAQGGLDEITGASYEATVTAIPQTGTAEGELATTARDRRMTIIAGTDHARAEGALATTARDRRMTIIADADTGSANGELATAARDRRMTITADANTGSAESELNSLTRQRFVTITPRVVPTSVLVRVDGGG